MNIVYVSVTLTTLYGIKTALIDFSGRSREELMSFLGISLHSDLSYFIGCDFCVRDCVIEENSVKFQIWSLSPSFNNFHELYLMGTTNAVVFFDFADITCKEKIRSFLQTLCHSTDFRPLPVVLLGVNYGSAGTKGGPSIREIRELIQIMSLENHLDVKQIQLVDGDRLLSEMNAEIIFCWLACQFLKSIRVQVRAPTNEITLVNGDLELPPIVMRTATREYFSSLAQASALYCVSDRRKVVFAEINDWIFCEDCKRFLCPSCYSFYRTEGLYVCPGSAFGHMHRIAPIASEC